MTIDVTKAIEPKSDQLNADDLLTGPRTIRIRDVKVSPGQEQPVWIYFDGDNGKPWKSSKTGTRSLAAIWGPDAARWIGLRCTIYCDPDVTWGGAKVGGIRVSHMEGLTQARTLMLTKTRGKRGATVIKPLDAAPDPEPKQPDAPHNDELLSDARDAARGGRSSFEVWWKANPDARAAAGAIMDELKGLVSEADGQGGGNE